MGGDLTSGAGTSAGEWSLLSCGVHVLQGSFLGDLQEVNLLNQIKLTGL